ncbi:hypothetical protein [Nonomuraea gerenzanensis]|uniref:Uncharacterized protein n=1 Tax=Nonomuraea gerenzanensis TaxID=93944 RepID=A0A1M4EG74_9ACTN|nr:hypothetical protein [Nonomuraea gerenzanensis]UBU09310.1 hypothetical protein LCN96_33675 [Nonomuraea gerenzanensis]SBO97716.1 hypothetical protein BN4615_P7232 [Nonomuraea gerenzanensis]
MLDLFRYLVMAAFLVFPVAIASGAVSAARLSAPRGRSARTGLSALCGTVLGVVAGCPIGMLLIWPLTVRTSWLTPARSDFVTPWAPIAVLAVALPVLAAVLGALPARESPRARHAELPEPREPAR